jgi:hypothetical protein
MSAIGRFERVAELLFGSIEWPLTTQSQNLSVRALPCSQNGSYSSGGIRCLKCSKILCPADKNSK